MPRVHTVAARPTSAGVDSEQPASHLASPGREMGLWLAGPAAGEADGQNLGV